MRTELMPLLTAIFIITPLFGFYAFITDTALMLNQVQHEQPIGEIFGNTTVGQQFVATDNDLNKIDILFATYDRENTGQIIFYLREGNKTNILVNQTIDTQQIGNNRYHGFMFEPIPDSKGKTYIFTLSAPESSQGNAITIWYNAADEYYGGSALLNDSFIQGDLNFKVHHPYSSEDFIIDFFNRLIQDLNFFIFYVILLFWAIIVIIWRWILDP